MNQFGYGYNYYDYLPNTQASSGVEAGAVVGIFLGIMMAFYFLVIVMGVVFYILQSLGVYTIAKRRGIRKPWLAWIPLGDVWTIGSISDQYQYVKLGKVTNRRKVLLTLYILELVAVALIFGGTIGALVNAVFSNGGAMVMGFGGVVLGYLGVVVISVILAVMLYIAFYDVFRSCSPDNSVLYLILSILFPVTLPFFLFFSRKKDEGMPPRKQMVVEELPEEYFVEETAEEPIEEETTEE